MTSGGVSIDATARVHPQAMVGRDVTIGPYCIIDANVAIGDGCRLAAHVHVTGFTTIGAHTVIYPFASLGTPPQSLNYRGGATRLEIGSRCDIRENVTINVGTEDGGGLTRVGDSCFLMAGSHVAHDCSVGNEVVFANNVALGGHVTVGNFVVFGGQSAVRQFVRIGEGVMVVGLSGVRADVIPWAQVSGRLACLVGLNVIGMKRRGFSKSEVHSMRHAYQRLFCGPGTFRERLDSLSAEHGDDARVSRMIEFVRSATRPLTMAVAGKP
jgi:UDP-N-acetylglucosamine acyltransferase